MADRYLSDHSSVLCSLNSAKPDCVAKITRYRQLRAIDFDALRQDLEKSKLCTREYSDLNELTSSYNSTLTSLLDKHAPMKEKVVVCRQRLPWFNSEIKCAIRTRRKAERKWRRTKSQQDFRAFKGARNRATFVMNGTRCEYYTSLIAENSSNQWNLFRTTKSLLCEPSGVSFPKDIAPDDLANDFGNFFMQKIDKINQLIDMQSSLEMSKAREKGCADSDTCAGVTFANFKTLSREQVSELIKKAAKKSCPLDPMPTSVVLEVLDVLLPVITNMINLSFESGEFASDWKEALLKPLLKKCGLDIAFHNFCPVSNLPYVSKLSEKAAANQLIDHMTTNDLHMPLQSAYKQNESTESALLKVKNDILLNMEARKVTLLVLLDLSAAFDTVRHDTLLNRLKSRFGVDGKALEWFASYLADRTQRVTVNDGLSSAFPLRQGVSQGSCLGPLLFTVYTSKLFDIVSKHLPSVHCYADDTQLYLAFSPDVEGEDEAALNAMRDCIHGLRNWMIEDRLMLNDDKTELMLIGTRQQSQKVSLNDITVGDTVVGAKSVVRNLGSWFDRNLDMSSHISKQCASAFYHLHNISRIRRFLSTDTTKALVHAFVTSCVDYFNSLLYGLPASHLNKVQRVLNAAARLVCRAPRYCRITPLLYELHWLPVRQRISFKILLFVFKAIHGFAPTYLRELVSIKRSGNYNLRSSSDGLLLATPTYRSRVTLGDRSFQVAAPALWNVLLREIRSITDLGIFKRHLKTHLFREAFY